MAAPVVAPDTSVILKWVLPSSADERYVAKAERAGFVARRSVTWVPGAAVDAELPLRRTARGWEGDANPVAATEWPSWCRFRELPR